MSAWHRKSYRKGFRHCETAQSISIIRYNVMTVPRGGGGGAFRLAFTVNGEIKGNI